MHCDICQGSDLVGRRYLQSSLKARLATSLPSPVASVLGRSFRGKYNRLRCDQDFFGKRTLFYCPSCSTGFASPSFDEHELDSYYAQAYWAGRASERPAAERDKIDRIARGQKHCIWLAERIEPVDMMIDFGCGECFSAIAFSDAGMARQIVCYDKAEQSRSIATGRGFGYADALSELPQADLFYSSHSLEHVHDLNKCFEIIVSKINPGGHLFFEVPNIRNCTICLNWHKHTPHTYMISLRTFERLAERFGLALLEAEEAGKLWSGLMHADATDTDLQHPNNLRVLFRKE